MPFLHTIFGCAARGRGGAEGCERGPPRQLEVTSKGHDLPGLFCLQKGEKDALGTEGCSGYQRMPWGPKDALGAEAFL